MKKGIFLLIGSCLLLALTGCGKTKDNVVAESKYVKVSDYDNLKVSVPKSTITEANIKSYVERMIDSYAPSEGTKPTYEQLTDDFVATEMEELGFKTVKELKQAVSEYLNGMNEYYAENNTRQAVMEELMKISTIKSLPEGLLEERVEQYIKLFKASCKEQYGVTYEEYLSTYQMTEDSFRSQTEATMKETIESELVLLEIAKVEGIKIEEKDYKEFVEQMLQTSGYKTEEDLYADYGKEYIEDSYICDKVLTMLVEDADVTYVTPGGM